MLLRLATPADVSGIAAMERLDESRRYVGQWSEDRHLAALVDADVRYYVNEDASGEIAAYVILRGLTGIERAIELKRVVVARPGNGLGRQILIETLHIAFHELGAHRLFLDVVEDNARARHLYESLGFVHEGILRDAMLCGTENITLCTRCPCSKKNIASGSNRNASRYTLTCHGNDGMRYGSRYALPGGRLDGRRGAVGAGALAGGIGH